ncbi:hypothetical protein H072_1495 [Dactylellina haptotyla CBS 200.50]|uniref:Uncharacterized protein n=1 Tax=Dactylellina haptotyla (strain CBS 200.50) TaxID=1284197 RepID=S8ANU7_DACHA|nr:hypothetical protein H072_1495 [Dactylellina haptotyla CBS 200.50]
MTSMWKRMVKGGRKDRDSRDLTQFPDQPRYGDTNTKESAFAMPYHQRPPSSELNNQTSKPSVFVEYDRSAPRESQFAAPQRPRDNYRADPYANLPYSYPPYQQQQQQPPQQQLPQQQMYPHNPNDYSRGYQRPPGPPGGAVQSSHTEASIAPVSYGAVSPLQEGPDSTRTFAPVQYSSIGSPAAVDYSRAQPTASPPGLSSVKSPAGVDYPRSPPAGGLIQPPVPAPAPTVRQYDYTSLNEQVQRPPSYAPAPATNPLPPVKTQQYAMYAGPVENMSDQRRGYNHQEHEWVPNLDQQRHQNEVPANKQPQRYENHFPNTPVAVNSNNSSSSSLYAPPISTNTTSTAPTPAYSTPERTNFQQQPMAYVPNSSDKFLVEISDEKYYPGPSQGQKSPSTAQGSGTSKGKDPNVSKYVVRIFCQRKREDGDNREESPRDIREFRLANLALINLVAGGQKYVLLDAVFGELDKPVASLLEKHWFLSTNTKVEEYSVSGGKRTVRIERIMVAYRGVESTLYVEFKSEEDHARFATELYYAKNTIST